MECLGADREAPPALAAEQIAAVLDVSAAAGFDLFRVVQEVTQLQAAPDGEMPNRILLERARLRLQTAARPM